ncbi:Transposase [Lactobacillus plantarum ZJ316] [Lactiplantibacillus mudanjiangensis]|uniref:Transposase [Lactobacillus plantarum ZJ316] n=2 Tax=Lactiplantibacillus mudanjiangensis TaxID=1296538 RepID=A0A660E4Y4_9LACO|nr:Transposase [Lactobacillus plantarum ZJ316] [Lactiplantibacillus mudanjiangensis]VDG30372.1 Transposase [Lactobacillus plantarum ZJ316] [Lactiplantibacillus mudanjiangensis]
MCRFMNVSRAAYYKWIHRKPSKRETEDKVILAYIQKLEEENHYTFGVQRLVMNLNLDTPYYACPSKMRRIMKENGIKASIRIAKRDRKAERKEHISNNLLLTEDGHNFKPDNSNEIWVTDCTELKFGWKYEKHLRLSAIKDLCDHSIIAWSIDDTETADLVTHTIDMVLEENGVKPMVLHSDQGSSYTSGRFNDRLGGYGIQHSMSRPGTPGDNSPMESFWRHVKTEFFRFEHALNRDQMISLIEQCIDQYNNKHRQETLNGMTPKEFRDHAILKTA